MYKKVSIALLCCGFIGGIAAYIFLRPTVSPSIGSPIAFFFQYVGAFEYGVGKNGVTAGTSLDGISVTSSTTDAMIWSVGKQATKNNRTYGDPVISYLPSGMWAMTAWSGSNDPRGQGRLLYAEASCPTIDENSVIAIGASSAKECARMESVTSGKTSQVFSQNGNTYIFHSMMGEVYITQLSSPQEQAHDLTALCILKNPVEDISDLTYSSSTKIISKADAQNITLSDTAFGQREDGTWVLFVKGIKQEPGCTATDLCELCNRSIYRTTSTDLITWSPLEKVIERASVPEATTMPDGTVWLYWQDFSDTCDAQDKNVAARAPISSAYEQPGSYELSEPVAVTFTDETFETNTELHYATNGNPVSLPSQQAYEAFLTCVE